MAGIEVSRLCWAAGKHKILQDITFSVAPRTIYAIIGPSGSGKTSLLRCIAGLNADYTGQISLDCETLDSLALEKRGAVLMRQGSSLFPHLTAAENIAFGLRARHRPASEIRAVVDELLSMTRLRDKSGAYPSELSAGQMQRVALAMALAVKPRAILLDEPFSNLDPVLAADIRAETYAILDTAPTTTILATHDWEDAFLQGNRVGLILEGRLVPLAPDGSADDPAAACYLRDLRVVEGMVDDGIFRALGITFATRTPNGPCRALVTADSVTLLLKKHTSGIG